MISNKDLAREIESIGFRCKRCGTCCRSVSSDSNLVMVFPDEVRAIISSSGLVWDRIAEPYPETMHHCSGAKFTIGWCLRHKNDHCHFLNDGICTIYASRPWICRTYPFMLDGDMLVVSPCEGLGQSMSEQEATTIASTLLQRQCAEKEEEQRVRRVLQQPPLPAGKFIVIDSDGVRVIDG